MINVCIAGSKFFGYQVFERLKNEVNVCKVIAPAEDDRLAVAAKAHGTDVSVVHAKTIGEEYMPEGVDLIVAAYLHSKISHAALAKSKHGAIGYHPSLLPRHRGIASVEWTIKCKDPVAGGSIYILDDGWDHGEVVTQRWCFVDKDWDATALWRERLHPMGVDMIVEAVQLIQNNGYDKLPRHKQDERYATLAPRLKEATS
ncbi:MAG TPA: formyltransferase family protein [Chitinophagales bacterium]|nr:formyltransferase family protein [Chitinophagales bacterium]